MPRPKSHSLTRREEEVLRLLRRDYTNEQITECLGISLDGAKYHVSEILTKLGVSSREEAAAPQPEPKRLLGGPVLALSLVGKAIVVCSSALVISGVVILGLSVASSGAVGDGTVASPTLMPTAVPPDWLPRAPGHAITKDEAVALSEEAAGAEIYGGRIGGVLSTEYSTWGTEWRKLLPTEQRFYEDFVAQTLSGEPQ